MPDDPPPSFQLVPFSLPPDDGIVSNTNIFDNEIIANVYSIMAVYIPIKDPTNEEAHISVIQVCSSEHTILPSVYSTFSIP